MSQCICQENYAQSWKCVKKNQVFGRFLTVLTPKKALMAIKLYQLININPLSASVALI